jgi:chromosome segregation ATPase
MLLVGVTTTSFDTILLLGGAASIPTVVIEFVRYLNNRQNGQNAQSGVLSATIAQLFKEIAALQTRCNQLDTEIQSLRDDRHLLSQAVELYREILRRVRGKSGMTGEQIETAAHEDELEITSKLRGTIDATHK